MRRQLLALILAGMAGGIRAESLPLAALLAVPYPTQIATARDADRVVWVLNEAGVRNLWTSSGSDLEPRRLTSYEEDDGQPLGSLRLTPRGDLVVYVRGGGENRAGEHPNPTSDPAGVDRTIWAVSTDGGEAWSLGEGSTPVVSPAGSRLLLQRADGLYMLDLPGEAPEVAVEPQRLFSARGTTRGAVFSPDGGRIAFVSDRGDHSFIGVFDLDAETLRWIAPSVDRDGFPAWSPDGTRLAFLRRDGALKDEIFTFLTSWQFRILVADVETGEAKEVWRSPESGGGFAQIYPAAPLRWVGDSLVFYSEHSGWMHLHSVSADGGKVVDLTPGDCEVEHSDVAPAGEWLVFSHNCDEIDGRQLGIVSPGGRAESLALPHGIHTSPSIADEGRRIYLRSSDARRPIAVAMVSPQGTDFRRLEAGAWPDGLDLDRLVEPMPLTFRSGDGLEIHAQLFEPRQPPPEAGRPAVIFMHGGPMRQMLPAWHYMEYYAHCYAFNQFLASRGWTVLSVNFRSGIGYGQDFRLAPRQGPYGASEYQDIVAAGKLLRSRDDVDGDRIALWGGSYGGYLTALGLARDSDLFAAGVDLHGVHDWSFRATDFTEGGGWGIQGEAAHQVALQSSPVFDVSMWTSPVLLVHGDDDRNVLFQQTTDLAVRLRRQGLEPEILVLPDEVHGFLRYASWLEVFEAASEFLERHLGQPGQ